MVVTPAPARTPGPRPARVDDGSRAPAIPRPRLGEGPVDTAAGVDTCDARTPRGQAPARVAMIVLNACNNDARVLRTARAVAEYADVRVFALGNSSYSAGLHTVSGVMVQRLEVRSLFVRTMWRLRWLYMLLRSTPIRKCPPAGGGSRPLSERLDREFTSPPPERDPPVLA